MAANIEKIADPTKKERLVASKKAWNKSVKLLIAKLIAFKRAINGEGDPDAMLPKVDLKEPFPVEFHTYLESIVEDYNKVIHGGEYVMNLQDNFSTTRRKSQKELRELAASIEQNELVSEGSWWGSRAWAWFALGKLGKDQRKIRMSMLTALNNSRKALKILEYDFLAREDIKSVIGITKFLNSYVGSFYRLLDKLLEIDDIKLPTDEPKQLEQSPSSSKEPPKEDQIGDTIISGEPPSVPDLSAIRASVSVALNARLNALESSALDPAEKENLKSLFKRLSVAAANPETHPDDEFMDLYNLFVAKLQKAESIVSNAISEYDEYKKIAQNIIQRWWKRHTLTKSDVDQMRKLISDEIRDAMRQMAELMDDIEKPSNSTEYIKEKSDEIAITLRSVADLSLRLADNYRLEWRMESDTKKRPPKLEEIITNKLIKLRRAL